jgi:hypothetical protein
VYWCVVLLPVVLLLLLLFMLWLLTLLGQPLLHQAQTACKLHDCQKT